MNHLHFKSGDVIIELGGADHPIFHPNYDIRNLPNVDRVIDLNNNNPLPVPDNIYDLIYSRYFIEHIGWRNINNLLAEMYRILKPEGKIILITANLLEQAKVLVNTDSSQWNDELIGMIFGGQDYNENAHRCGFSQQSITKILTNIGFKDIKIDPINSKFGPTDMVVQAVKT